MKKDDIFLAKWLDGELDDEKLRQYVSEEELSSYREILAEIDNWVPDNDIMLFDPAEITSEKPLGKKVRFSPWTYASVAAAVVLLMVAGIFLLPGLGGETYYADGGTRTEVVLPDGSSRVVLAAGAKLAWDGSDWTDAKRTVNLEGKAHFSVAAGSPFTVETAKGKVQVLGTQFTVSDLSKKLRVTCYEGLVQAVAGADGETVKVSAGEEATFSGNRWEAKKRISGNSPDWLTEQKEFTNAELREVISSLERIFDITVDEGDADLQSDFTGVIPTNNLDIALEAVFTPYGISYRKKNGTVYLSK